jgi:aminomethyltransferase
MLRTPLRDWHHAHSGRMVEFAGWEMPIQYTSIVEEHTAVRQRVGLFDIAHMGRVFFSGPDAMSFLDHLLTNDVTKLKVGQVRYSLICNRAGGILDDVLIYYLERGIYMLVVNASNRRKILDWIEHHMEGYTLSAADETESRCMFAVQGPRAIDVLGGLTDVGLAEMKYYSVNVGKVAGANAIISRTGYTGEDGFELCCDNADAVRLWSALLEAAAPLGGMPVGLGARDSLRLEAKLPLYGNDLDDDHTPLEAGLGWAVKLDGRDFIGAAALRAQQQAGLTRQLVGFRIDEAHRATARHGYPVVDRTRTEGPTQIATVTSGGPGISVGGAIGLAYVPSALAATGTTLTIDCRGKDVPATVVAGKFYKRPSRR